MNRQAMRPKLETVPAAPAGARSAGRTFLLAAILVALASVHPAAANAQSYNSLVLTWTATGDDGNVGRASGYDLRYRTTPIAGTDTLSWWNGATSASGLPAPANAGAPDSSLVTGLTPSTTYYFILKVRDEAYNWSGYSNVATAATDACTAPTETPQQFAAAEDNGDVLLSWNAGSDPATTSIHVYRGLATGSLTLLTTLPAGDTGYRDTSVSAGTAYRYRAAFAAVCDGPSTATVSITLSGPPPPPPSGGTADARVHAYPNPSTGPVQFVLDVTGSATATVRLRLFDLAGHWIADLAEGAYTPGQHTISWPRTSREGGRVAPGYYEAIGTIGATKVRERLVLLP